MKINLKTLVLLTCIGLTGIISLQVYWLFKAYEEQKGKLLSDVDGVLLQTQLLTGVNAALSKAAQGLSKNIIKPQKNNKINPNEKKVSISTAEFKDSAADAALLQAINNDSFKTKDYSIGTYKKVLQENLKKEEITIPFEMALLSPNETILACTIDTMLYKNIDFKTKLTSLGMEIRLNSKQNGIIQLAFPEAALYLTKGMTLILTLSVLLIVICGFSFSYMVTLFFRQKKIAEIKNDFMNNMTHELKTPISSISVAMELLQDTDVYMPEEEKKAYFKMATGELERLTGLIDKVLRMAAFQKLQIKVKYDFFNVQDWITEGIKKTQPLITAENVQIITIIEPKQLIFFADHLHFNSILQNLLENAIKYADRLKTYKEITIRAKEDDQYYYLEVADNGIGIADQYLAKVFDKFFRIPTGNQHDIKGYGLGLSYVSEIVALHKGSISVQSKLSVGTTFKIKFPKIN